MYCNITIILMSDDHSQIMCTIISNIDCTFAHIGYINSLQGVLCAAQINTI